MIFIEAVAWFLLKQYRCLIEDFKHFTRLYLKHANYLSAYFLLSNTKGTPESQLLAAALIQEDLTGVLRTGDTLESIEKEKVEDKNPVFGLFVDSLMGLARIGKGANAGTEQKPVKPGSAEAKEAKG